MMLDDQTVFFALFAILASTGLFFFVVTRGALVLRGLSPGSASDKSMCIRSIRTWADQTGDFQPIISAILLFQYHHLVSKSFRAEAYGISETGRADHLMRKIGQWIPRG